MNAKEIAEIRRRYSPGKNNISQIVGCYVNEKGEVISEFSQSLALMPESEAEKFLALLKKSMTGKLNKNLVDIEFSTQQVTEGEQHKLLMAMRESSLQDGEAIHAFLECVIKNLALEGNYVILLAKDAYDVPYRASDGAQLDDASSDVFSYIQCCVCPVKQAKPALSYHASENEFHSRPADWVVLDPELGFMFPAFNDRAANIYSALYYSHSASDSHQEFVDAVFGSEVPMPAEEQKQAFQAVLSGSLEEDCSYEMVHAVHESLQQAIAEHKENKEEAPLVVTKDAMKSILRDNGASEESLVVFEEKYAEAFGEDTSISPENLVGSGQLKLTMPGVVIQVSAECSNLLETSVIDGKKYVLIRVEEGAELDGVPITISEPFQG